MLISAKFMIAATLLISVVTATAFAGNVRWMKDTALSKMTAEDMEVLRNAARNALDYGADGEPRRWENAETGAEGVLTPQASFERDGAFCRRLELFNYVKGVSGRSVYVFCRQKDGTWRIGPAAKK